MEVKIQIPDNCELIKNGDTYIVREKKQKPPKSWEEFCDSYSVKDSEYFITPRSSIASKNNYGCDSLRRNIEGRNWCTSMEEAQAFLALMQLRQLRKAWVEDFDNCVCSKITRNVSNNNVIVLFSYDNSGALTFPTEEIARDFLECFKDLCETAKILL